MKTGDPEFDRQGSFVEYLNITFIKNKQNLTGVIIFVTGVLVIAIMLFGFRVMDKDYTPIESNVMGDYTTVVSDGTLMYLRLNGALGLPKTLPDNDVYNNTVFAALDNGVHDVKAFKHKLRDASGADDDTIDLAVDGFIADQESFQELRENKLTDRETHWRSMQMHLNDQFDTDVIEQVGDGFTTEQLRRYNVTGHRAYVALCHFSVVDLIREDVYPGYLKYQLTTFYANSVPPNELNTTC